MSSIEIDRDKGIDYHCNCVRVLCLNVANVANKAAIAHVRACDLRTNADNVIGSGDTEAGVITQGGVELAGDAGKSLPTISAKPDGVWAGSQPSILGGERPGLLTRTATTGSALLHADEKLTAFLEAINAFNHYDIVS